MKDPSIIETLISVKNSLSKKHKVLCDYLLENQQEIGIMTVKELATNANVGTTTVMRFIKDLGYQNFFDFRKEFFILQKDSLNRWEDVQNSFKTSNAEGISNSITQVWEEGINLLARSMNPDLIENFSKAIELLKSASRINIYGGRPYKASALYLELLLGEYIPNLLQLSNDSEAIFDKVLQFQKDEVLVLFSLEPYLTKTLHIAQIVNEKGIPVILFTDQLSSPVAPYANCILQVEVSSKHYSVLPIFALIEAIAIELGRQNSDAAAQKFQELVKTLRETDTIL